MNDRELLEMAARAAGIKLTNWQNVEHPKNSGLHGALYCMSHYWNPLTDDGDALRLAVKLEMTVRNFGHLVSAMAPNQCQADEYSNGDPCAATRRAIVRAAAEIGREMKE